jgi:hypothetical protein
LVTAISRVPAWITGGGSCRGIRPGTRCTPRFYGRNRPRNCRPHRC